MITGNGGCLDAENPIGPAMLVAIHAGRHAAGRRNSVAVGRYRSIDPTVVGIGRLWFCFEHT